MSWIDIARVWWELGYTVLPVAADGTKRPAMPWGDYKIDRPGLQTIEWMFTRYKTDGLGVVCGSASGGLEMIEFEGRAVQDRLPAKLQTIFQNYGNGDLWETINRYA